jgi:multidrug transporter EmrE-like cation transporter
VPAARATIAALLLYAGALNAWAALTIETCTMGAADSLFGGILTVGLNLVGFRLLGSRQHPAAFIATAILPAIAAVFYTTFAVKFGIGHFGSGVTACHALTGARYEADGREPLQVIIWIAASLSFWFGLALAIGRSIPTIGADVERTD